MSDDTGNLQARIAALTLQLQAADQRAQDEAAAKLAAEQRAQNAEQRAQDEAAAKLAADQRAQNAEQRAQDEAAAKLAAEQRANTAEAERKKAGRLARIRQLASSDTVNIPQVARDASRSLPGSTAAQQLANLATCAPWTACLSALPERADEGAVCLRVARDLGDDQVPADRRLEREAWHPIVARVVQLIGQVSKELRIPVLKPYYETATDDRRDTKEPDFAFTLPSEQRRLHANTCFLLEVKGTERAGISRSQLLREGVAQAIRYLAQRQEALSDMPSCGIACVSSGAVGLLIVHINFDDDRMPVTISNELYLLPRPEDRVPDGLRALVRLLHTVDVTPFGLKALSFEPAPPYRVLQMLGVGGFATVEQITSESTGSVMACKWLRHADAAVLRHERDVLDELARAEVPFVPRVCSAEGDGGIITNADGTRNALLLMPVGISCRDALKASVDRVKLAVAALEHVWRALCAAHAAQYTHGDVRPSNIIETVSSTVPGAGAMCLIDWGLAQRLGQRYEKREMHGVPAFMSARRLNLLLSGTKGKWQPEAEDDLQAAVLTFFALVSTDDGHAPWPEWTFPASSLVRERAVWIAQHASMLRAAAEHITLPEAQAAVIAAIASATREAAA